MTRPEVEIKALQLTDLDGIMSIEPAVYGAHHWSRQSFINELTNPAGCYFGAVNPIDDTILGYSGFWLIQDEAHITTLAVHPEQRRQKIGERLLINNIIEARKLGANWMTLEVRVSNEAAQELYYKYGFRRLGVRPRYYQDNSEDALILWTDRLSEQKFVDVFVPHLQKFDMPVNGVCELFLGAASLAS
ncbi:MAG: ribosomal protein S18-alanine N-acetyltransferase [Candidatus Melainabacteria bacterium]|nr:ribosomal protein S18-alanine N-acetyltransferase [Candidatus Melainabacteria bacterium]